MGGTTTAKETLWVMEQQNFSLVEQNIWLARYQIHNKQLQPQGCCKLNTNCWPQSGIWVRGSVRVRKEPQQGASLKAGPTHYQQDLFLWHKIQACSPPQCLVKGKKPSHQHFQPGNSAPNSRTSPRQALPATTSCPKLAGSVPSQKETATFWLHPKMSC